MHSSEALRSKRQPYSLATPQQADNIAGRVRFQDALEEARPDHYAEIGSSSKLTKEVVVGQSYRLAERLAQDREDYKATDSLLKLAKIQGWVGAEPDSLWTTFGKLSQEDIDAIKRLLKEQVAEREGQANQRPSELPQAGGNLN